jgi:hypothetical protein
VEAAEELTAAARGIAAEGIADIAQGAEELGAAAAIGPDQDGQTEDE